MANLVAIRDGTTTVWPFYMGPLVAVGHSVTFVSTETLQLSDLQGFDGVLVCPIAASTEAARNQIADVVLASGLPFLVLGARLGAVNGTTGHMIDGFGLIGSASTSTRSNTTSFTSLDSNHSITFGFPSTVPYSTANLFTGEGSINWASGVSVLALNNAATPRANLVASTPGTKLGGRVHLSRSVFFGPHASSELTPEAQEILIRSVAWALGLPISTFRTTQAGAEILRATEGPAPQRVSQFGIEVLTPFYLPNIFTTQLGLEILVPSDAPPPPPPEPPTRLTQLGLEALLPNPEPEPPIPWPVVLTQLGAEVLVLPPEPPPDPTGWLQRWDTQRGRWGVALEGPQGIHLGGGIHDPAALLRAEVGRARAFRASVDVLVGCVGNGWWLWRYAGARSGRGGVAVTSDGIGRLDTPSPTWWGIWAGMSVGSPNNSTEAYGERGSGTGYLRIQFLRPQVSPSDRGYAGLGIASIKLPKVYAYSELEDHLAQQGLPVKAGTYTYRTVPQRVAWYRVTLEVVQHESVAGRVRVRAKVESDQPLVAEGLPPLNENGWHVETVYGAASRGGHDAFSVNLECLYSGIAGQQIWDVSGFRDGWLRFRNFEAEILDATGCEILPPPEPEPPIEEEPPIELPPDEPEPPADFWFEAYADPCEPRARVFVHDSEIGARYLLEASMDEEDWAIVRTFEGDTTTFRVRGWMQGLYFLRLRRINPESEWIYSSIFVDFCPISPRLEEPGWGDKTPCLPGEGWRELDQIFAEAWRGREVCVPEEGGWRDRERKI